MKKKVALLLALVMVLAMIPTNVFGARVSVIPTPVGTENPQDWRTQFVTVDINVADLIFGAVELPGGLGQGAWLRFTTTPIGDDMWGYTHFDTFGWSGTGNNRVPVRHTSNATLVRSASDSLVANITGGRFLGIGGGTAINRVGAATTAAAINFDILNPDAQDVGTQAATPSGAVVNSQSFPGWPGIRDTGTAWAGVDNDRPAGEQDPYWLRTIGGVRPNQILTAVRFLGMDADNLATTGQALTNYQGNVQVVVGVNPRTENARLTVELVNAQGGVMRTLINDQPIVAASATAGVEFTVVGGARTFQQGFVLPRIEIRERAVNSMNNTDGTVNRQIRMIAPFDYAWNVGVPGAIGTHAQETALAIRSLNGAIGPAGNIIAGGVGAGAATPITARGSVTSDGRHILDLEFTLPARSAGLAGAQRALLGLDGVLLVPVQGAPAEGNINIDISWGNAGENIAHVREMDLTPNTRTPITAAGVMFHTGWWAPNWRQHGMAIGTRAEVGLELRVAPGTDIPTLVSGIVGPSLDRRLRAGSSDNNLEFPSNNWAATSDPANSSVPNHATRSARLQLVELAPGAFDTGFLNSTVEFTFPEGVQLVHASWRLTSDTVAARVGQGGAGSNLWMDVPEGLLISDGFPTGLPGGGVLDGNLGLLGVPFRNTEFMSIFIPTNPVPTATRTLEVDFFFSVEAGFVWKYDSTEIPVTVAGSAVNNLGNASHELVVANVTDPISLELDGGLLQVETGRTHNLMELTRIGDAVISEDTHGRLRANDVIWVYVVGTNIQRAQTLAFHTAANAVVDSGDIVLDPAQRFVQRLANGLEVQGVSFRVRRASTSGNPSTIRLTDNYLFGEILPGQDYMLVVSGPRLAANELQVAGNRVFGQTAGVTIQVPVFDNATPPNIIGWQSVTIPGTATGGNVIQPRTQGIFDTLPYAVPVVEWVGFDPDVIPPADEAPGGIGGFVRTVFTVETMVDGIQAVAFPEIAPGVNAAMMNPRVFANLLGLEYNWDDATRSFTFSGVTAMGESVTVVTTLDSTNIVINGETFDIATRARQPRFAGQIAPVVIGGRQYVPVRVLAETFGVPVSGTGSSVTLG